MYYKKLDSSYNIIKTNMSFRFANVFLQASNNNLVWYFAKIQKTKNENNRKDKTIQNILYSNVYEDVVICADFESAVAVSLS